MNMISNLSSEKALYNALRYAGIENEEIDCLLKRYEDGLYHFLVRTGYVRYEFYVEAGSGTVLGITSEPLSYGEVLAVCGSAGAALSAVA